MRAFFEIRDDKNKPRFASHLLSLTVTDNEGCLQDRAVITLKGYVPLHDVSSCSIAFAPREDQLTDHGKFLIDEVVISQNSTVLNLSSVDLHTDFKKKYKTKSWNTSFGDLVSIVASNNALKFSVSDSLKKIKITEPQSDESDAGFVNRLARQHGAILKIQDEYLIVAEPGKLKDVQGKSLPTHKVRYTINPVFTQMKKNTYTGVAAYYWDNSLGQRVLVHVGNPSKEKILSPTWDTHEQARQRAKTELKTLGVVSAKLTLTLLSDVQLDTAKIAYGHFLEISNQIEEINGRWSVKSITHQLNMKDGLRATLECVRGIVDNQDDDRGDEEYEGP